MDGIFVQKNNISFQNMYETGVLHKTPRRHSSAWIHVEKSAEYYFENIAYNLEMCCSCYYSDSIFNR